MNPTPFYFGPPTRPLLGWYHAANGSWRDTAVVLCPPLGYQHLTSYRTMRMLAMHLSDLGFAVVRFDYPGMGDSGGDEHEAGLVHDWIESIHLAGAEARRLSGASATAGIGLGIGATLLAHAGARHPLDAVVLWAPAPSGRRFIRGVKMLQAAGDDRMPASDVLEAGGFSYPDALVEEIEALDLFGLDRAPAPKVLLATRDDLPRMPRVEKWLRASGTALTVRSLPGLREVMDVSTMNAVPAEAAGKAIAGWLADTFPARGAPPSVNVPFATRAAMRVPAAPDEITEAAVWFGDHGLFGVVSEPASEPAETALLLLNTGRERRIGTSRMWVRLGRAWAAAGFRVLRMDLSGLGDSPVRPGGQADTAYSTSASSDIRDAVAYLQTLGSSSIVPIGLCSGGYWAVLAAGDDLPLSGVCAINPQLYWHPGASEALLGTLGNAREMDRMTLSAASPGKWARLLTGQISFRRVLRTVVQQATAGATSRQLAQRAREAMAELDRLKQLPGDSLLVFAKEDYGLDFLQLYQSRAFRRLVNDPRIRLELISDADHSFTRGGPRLELENLLYQHVMRRASQPMADATR